MARYIGGDLLGITLNHPELGTFEFVTKSDESYNIDPGGYRSADEDTGITGGGEFIDKMNRKRWSFEGMLVLDFKSGTELDAFTAISQSASLGTWTFSHISGAIWRGRGKFVGDFSADSNTGSASVKVSGSKSLELL